MKRITKAEINAGKIWAAAIELALDKDIRFAGDLNEDLQRVVDKASAMRLALRVMCNVHEESFRTILNIAKKTVAKR